MRMTHKELSDGIAEDKAKNIIATAVSTVVTGCPGCRLQIADSSGGKRSISKWCIRCSSWKKRLRCNAQIVEQDRRSAAASGNIGSPFSRDGLRAANRCHKR